MQVSPLLKLKDIEDEECVIFDPLKNKSGANTSTYMASVRNKLAKIYVQPIYEEEKVEPNYFCCSCDYFK